MLFDFDTFTRVAKPVYEETGSPYSFQDVLTVFRYFFETYENEIGEVHPPVKREQIRRIINAMPWYDKPCCCAGYSDIDPEAYPVLIDSYFKTPFRDCNFRINHFFSGNIRTLRMFEELY